MKVLVGIGVVGLVFSGCARDETTEVTTAAPPLNRTETTTNAGPETGVGAAATASSGIGTATASGSSAVESDAARAKQENATNASPAGTGAQNPTVNSNGVGNAGGSTSPNPGLNR